MNYQIVIKRIDTVNEVEGYWSDEDLVQLLEKFNYPDGATADKASLPELLEMAISDYEPNEAAEIVLKYKLPERLTEGQIEQIAHDMLIDKVCEEYPEIDMQGTLFHINQLLFKAYNGKFPNAKASIVHFSMTPNDNEPQKLTAENVLKLLNNGLSDRNLIKRLFENQMSQNIPFPEAEDIVWELTTTDDINYNLVTSENWINSEDINEYEFESVLEQIEDEA
ncbi:hypothetical protein FLA105534_03084 [Flavobacterium bizetiae]|uniref:Uncharacterized protein n=1 Tax=Flavobacterium bizetiae TaxID=2704140 RepID=A0A6J4GN74_9FLAO|nr:hypothetical protein [Flavobacterium bizetiae]CAA9200344.1 hypothetical protein FLA105534_03084 [Flavobacterium bizetiae]CAD5344633.1 hypothetical protein FLA105535_04641 [Flavobacterium bizetiae]CAD5349775.1 hypothetical protein FLA105534_03762 [Flavobacterium bizetiae]